LGLTLAAETKHNLDFFEGIASPAGVLFPRAPKSAKVVDIVKGFLHGLELGIGQDYVCLAAVLFDDLWMECQHYCRCQDVT